MLDIGLVGLGNIGLPMAINFMKKGYRVKAFDTNPVQLDAFAKAGGVAAGSALEAARGAAVVVTVLATDAAVLDVLVESGMMKGMPAGTLFIECSTIGTDTFDRVLDESDARGHELADAPLAGGAHGAREGSLTFMVGCRTEAFDRVAQVMSAVGKKIIHAGPPKSGLICKICNNLIVGVAMAGVSEAFALAGRLGMDAQMLYKVISNSTGQTWVMDYHCPVPGVAPTSAANNGYKPGGKSTLMLKDLKIVQRLAAQNDLPVPTANQVLSLFTIHCNGEGADLDYSSIIQLLDGTMRTERRIVF